MPRPADQMSGTASATAPDRVSQSALDGSRLRVLLMLDVVEGQEERFLEAYARMSEQVTAVPGHVCDQLCQSIENPSQWLLTSEWIDAPHFLAWADSPAHLEMVKPMRGCVRDTRSLRYSVLRETPARPGPGASAGSDASTAPAPRGGTTRRSRPRPEPRWHSGDGTVRHALTFTVKPGSETEVASILSGYAAPRAEVDEATRLLRTSLFMHGNRVVRAVEVRGELVRALRHVAAQPGVRAAEQALDPYLELDRDLSDPASAREFFARAALPAVHHVGRRGGARQGEEVWRHAVSYPVKPGCATAVARMLARYDERAAADGTGPLVGATVFLRDGLVVRVVDLRVPAAEAPLAAAGVAAGRKAAVLGRLLDLTPLGAGADLRDRQALGAFLTAHDMRLVTDRHAPAPA
jgi:heme-degrading monooxygenase HmoA